MRGRHNRIALEKGNIDVAEHPGTFRLGDRGAGRLLVHHRAGGVRSWRRWRRRKSRRQRRGAQLGRTIGFGRTIRVGRTLDRHADCRHGKSGHDEPFDGGSVERRAADGDVSPLDEQSLDGPTARHESDDRQHGEQSHGPDGFESFGVHDAEREHDAERPERPDESRRADRPPHADRRQSRRAREGT